MDEKVERQVHDTFKILDAKKAALFDRETLLFVKDKWGTFEKNYNTFCDILEKEIKALPYNSLIPIYIGIWVNEIDNKINRSVRAKNKTEIGGIFRSFRKKLKVKLLEIEGSLTEQDTANKPVEAISKVTALTFKDIFVNEDWKKYIDALHQVENPVISKDYKFTGKHKKHKGVICCWINELKYRGKIYKEYSRQQLSEILNREIKGIKLGSDGKTFDNQSLEYENEYKRKLLRMTDLLP